MIAKCASLSISGGRRGKSTAHLSSGSRLREYIRALVPTGAYWMSKKTLDMSAED
jgi:hypothetical protein